MGEAPDGVKPPGSIDEESAAWPAVWRCASFVGSTADTKTPVLRFPPPAVKKFRSRLFNYFRIDVPKYANTQING